MAEKEVIHSNTPPKTVLICGTRIYHERFVGVVQDLLAHLEATAAEKQEPLPIIYSGAAPGIDTIAAREAKRRGFPVKLFPADWNRHGAAAGPIRNSQMIAAKPTQVYCLPYPTLETSRGTLDTYNKAKAARIPTVVVKLPQVG